MFDAMRKAVLLTLILAAWTAAPRAAASADRVDQLVRAYLKHHAIPSAAVAVVQKGRIVKAAGYGMANLELGAPPAR